MILEGIVIAKLLGLAGCYYGTWTVYNSFPGVDFKRRLSAMFRTGEMCLKKKGHNKDIKIYPKIHRVKEHADRMEAVFSIPTGYDPKEIYNHAWLFQQVFGPEIEITGDVKTFALSVYREGIQKFVFNVDEVKEAVKGKRLPIVVGRGRKGFIVYDMCECPHLLIAGETGSGKSVALRSILTSLILFAGDKIELHGADLKRSEFHLFRDIAEGKILHDAISLNHRLKKIQKEMKARGDLLDREGLANINDLPEAIRPKFIIVAVDEVALLQKSDCMEILEEISAIGRALGVFLILSMQRPDKDVLDGKLKNNLTVRMAFRHSDEINSRITIGTGEAAAIKQKESGRMVLLLDGLQSVQAPLLDIPEARTLLAPFKREPEKTPPEPPQDDTKTAKLGGLE